MSSESTPPRLDRRSALKLFATGAAAAAGAVAPSPAQTDAAKTPSPAPIDPASAASRGGYGDPSLTQPVKCPWPKLLSDEELRAASALADSILPADGKSPSASQAGVPAFIDEWISAPFPDQMKDRDLIRGGLVWLNTECHKRFEKTYAELAADQQQAICDDLCDASKARPEHVFGARFFDRFRDLTLTGFYTTAAGFEDLDYRGNIPTPKFAGPPPEVLKHLGLA